MSEPVPEAVWSGTFNIFGVVDLRCHVLDDGRRIIEAESVVELLAAMASPDCGRDDGGLQQFARWRSGIETKAPPG